MSRPMSVAEVRRDNADDYAGAIERAMEIERAMGRDPSTTRRELRRKWVLAARASGAARARGSEGALVAAADLRAVARRFHAREVFLDSAAVRSASADIRPASADIRPASADVQCDTCLPCNCRRCVDR